MSKPYPTSEAYFREADLFNRYVIDELNPARVSYGFDPVPPGAIHRLFQIVEERLYRPDAKCKEDKLPQ